MYRLSWNPGESASWNPQGLSRPIKELLYLYLCLCTAKGWQEKAAFFQWVSLGCRWKVNCSVLFRFSIVSVDFTGIDLFLYISWCDWNVLLQLALYISSCHQAQGDVILRDRYASGIKPGILEFFGRWLVVIGWRIASQMTFLLVWPKWPQVFSQKQNETTT
jgi:hypothetical protein